AKHKRDDQTGNRELKRWADRFANGIPDRSMVRQSFTEVAVKQTAHIGAVLLPERLVKAVLMADLLVPLFRDRLVAGENEHRVPWRQVGHKEREETDADQNRNRLSDSEQNVVGHGCQPSAVSFRPSAVANSRVVPCLGQGTALRPEN